MLRVTSSSHCGGSLIRYTNAAVCNRLVCLAKSPSMHWDPYSGQEKVQSPAAERNKQVILKQLQKIIPPSGLVIEIASGTGQHVTHFAAALSPELQWQPSDYKDELFSSIEAYTAHAKLSNVRQPVLLDASQPVTRWPVKGPVAAIFTSNLTHISPWPVTLGLVAGAGHLLQEQGVLLMYGPFKVEGQFTTDSNRQFHETLRSQNPEWGYRDVVDITAAAEAAGMKLEQQIAMPANNFLLVYRKNS